MGETEGYGQGIGRIGRQFFRRMEQSPDHRLDLLFPRPSVPNDRLLYFQGAVLLHVHPGFSRGQEGHPPRLPQHHGAFDILGVKGAFHCHELRAEFFDLLAETVIDLLQAVGKG
jgi:hypothetical protein